MAGERAVYLVGGPVRDRLLGRSPRDYFDLDLTVEGDALRLAAELAEELGAELISHPRFGTSTLRLPDGEIDLATARTEVYPHPGSLPVVQPGTLLEDLWRRDFTINALAQPVTVDGLGDPIDVSNGLEDLRAGLVRVLHPASFLDDPTRLFRAARFERRLGFRLEPQTLVWFGEAVRGGALSTVSPQRVAAEFRVCFEESEPLPVLERLSELGVFAALGLPTRWSAHRRRFLARLPRWESLLFELPRERREALLRRPALEWSTLLDRLRQTRHDSQLYELLKPLTGFELETLSARLERPEKIERFRQLAGQRPLLRGGDLSDRGLPTGPRFKEILQKAFSAQLDESWTEKQEALAWLDLHLADADL